MRQIKRIDSDGPLNAVAWAPDGTQLAVLSQYGSRINVISVNNWSIVRRIERAGNAYSQNSFSFLDNGQIITSSPQVNAENPGSLMLWGVNGLVAGYFPADLNDANFSGIRLSPALIFVASRDRAFVAAVNGATSREILVFDSVSRRLIRSIDFSQPLRATGFPRSLAFSPDNKKLAVGMSGGAVYIFDVNNGELQKTFVVSPRDMSCSAIVYSPNGEFIATGRAKNVNLPESNLFSVDIWRAETNVLVRSLEGETVSFGPNRETTNVTSLDWSATRDELAIGDFISVRVWRHPATKPDLAFSQSIRSGAYSVAFSPDGTLAIAGDDVVILR
jgi:WD40 repeat protein